MVKVKKTKKALVVQAPTKVKKTKPAKNTLAYYECMCHQAKQGLKGKKITGACHECKVNFLAINTKMSAYKKKDIQKLAKKHAEFKQALEEYISKH